jgi:hypothetical protein
MKPVTARVPPAPRYRPDIIDAVYDDPDAVLRLVQAGGPYPNLAGMAGYGGFNMTTMPWFRTLMAADGRPIVPGAEIILDNRNFIETAGKVFASEIVRPKAVTLNIMTPQGHGAAHLDTASFRGSFPTSSWLLSVMGSSGLFERWAVRVPAALTWFYTGEDGGYEFWPHGPNEPSAVVDPPFANRALVGDNDYMYHRVRAFGNPERFDDVALYTPLSSIACDGETWVVLDEGIDRVRYSGDQVRISLLWRGTAFANREEARVFDGHVDDLDAAIMIEVFLRDLEDRGISCERPTDPLRDEAWMEALNATYGTGGFDFASQGQ